ncbi:MAG: phospholipid carrier-dependent glycosyltransferase, partial [Mycobacteriales bacterium]
MSDTMSPTKDTVADNPTALSPARPQSGDTRRANPLPQLIRRGAGAVRANPGVSVVVLVGALLRGLLSVGYGPAFYFSDTRGYFEYADRGYPQAIRPYGYSGFLNLFRWTDSIWPVITAQHVLGLGCAIAVYVLVRRKGGARWLATLAAAPVALDGYELVLEHYILADSLFSVLLLAAILCLLWEKKVTTRLAIGAGVFLALATLTRNVALPLLALAGLYILLNRAGRRPFIALLLAMVLPMMGYVAWYHSHYGQYTISSWTDRWMYGRVMSIADCPTLHLYPQEEKLCQRPE